MLLNNFVLFCKNVRVSAWNSCVSFGVRRRRIQTAQPMEVTEQSKSENSSHIVWMDLEMTGLDIRKDKIIEISVLVTEKNLKVIAEGPCIAINYPETVFQEMNEWCLKTHNESGLVQKCLASQITLECAETMLLDFLKQHVPKGECPLGGSSVYMDRAFLRQHMPTLDEYLHYRIIDVSTIKELCRRWHPQVFSGAPEKTFTHRSLNDIIESINELQYYKEHLFKAT